MTNVFLAVTLMMAMPHNAFLKSKAESSVELARQVCSDAILRSKYSKTLGIDPYELQSYLLNLRKRTLSKSHNMVVYGLRKNGQVFKNNLLICKGENVWSEANGTPILLTRCGNPVRFVFNEHKENNVSDPFPSTPEIKEIDFNPPTNNNYKLIQTKYYVNENKNNIFGGTEWGGYGPPPYINDSASRLAYNSTTGSPTSDSLIIWPDIPDYPSMPDTPVINDGHKKPPATPEPGTMAMLLALSITSSWYAWARRKQK